MNIFDLKIKAVYLEKVSIKKCRPLIKQEVTNYKLITNYKLPLNDFDHFPRKSFNTLYAWFVGASSTAIMGLRSQSLQIIRAR